MRITLLPFPLASRGFTKKNNAEFSFFSHLSEFEKNHRMRYKPLFAKRYKTCSSVRRAD